MGRSRKEILEQCQKVKELYCKGYTIKEIAASIGMSKESVYNSFTIMGISIKKPLIDERNLVLHSEKTLFALISHQFMHQGKRIWEK